jgi:hypothetical protein
MRLNSGLFPAELRLLGEIFGIAWENQPRKSSIFWQYLREIILWHTRALSAGKPERRLGKGLLSKIQNPRGSERKTLLRWNR